MKFKYVGDDNAPPQQTTFMGVTFELGGTSETTDPVAVKKLRASRLFEEIIPTPSTAVGTTSERDACRATLLAAGVEISTRWGLPRLKKEVQKLGRNETRDC